MNIKLRANVGVLGFDAGEEFAVEDTPTIRGLVDMGYLTELVPVISNERLREHVSLDKPPDD